MAVITQNGTRTTTPLTFALREGVVVVLIAQRCPNSPHVGSGDRVVVVVVVQRWPLLMFAAREEVIVIVVACSCLELKPKSSTHVCSGGRDGGGSSCLEVGH